jgi:hypothetical protein
MHAASRIAPSLPVDRHAPCRPRSAAPGGFRLNGRRPPVRSLLAVLAVASLAGPAAAAVVDVSTGEASPGPLRLVGSRDRRQLIVTATPAGPETAFDVTGTTAWQVEPPTLATIQPGGLVVPLADGTGSIVASVPGEAAVRVPLVVERFGNDPPIDFVSQVVPVFTKYGCNGGGCHGKSGGQNGFRLSLLGFEPQEDHAHLLKEARGRRLSLVAPETSLLLAKAAAAVPHGGGRLIEPGSPSHDLLVRWIAEGANPSGPNPPKVSHIDVFPTERMLAAGRKQQLRVIAHYDDGRIEDVTRLAQFEASAPDLATVDVAGLVSTASKGEGPARCGSVAVMVRYQSQVAVFRGTLPLENPLERMPKPEQFVRNVVDEHVLAHLVKLRLPPSPVCDDSTFLRRATIDIAGRLPTLEETNAFLADSSPQKRDALVDRLLDSPDYASNFALKWSAILRNKRTDDQLHRNGTYAFHDWIRDRIAENKPYGEFVREILTATGEVDRNPAVIWYRQVADVNQQVEDASQLFMGLRLQCARCHHHPFEKWSTEDYFQLAAFFSRVGRKKGMQPGEDRIFHNRGTPQANGPKGAHKPAVLGSQPMDVPVDTDPRRLLADWLVAPDNPFFARSLVNRYWKHFFSIGLVEPEDDMRLTNPATNPALLDALAKSFVESGHDLKGLIRTICRSTTYQLSAEPNEFNAEDRQSFSRFFARRLPAEVALDAIDGLTVSRTGFGGVLPGTRAVELPDTSFNNYFLTVFGRPNGDSACECERGSEANLAQSLHLINSADILGKLGGGRATALAGDQARPIGEKIDELYRVAVSRPARPEEAAEIERYVAARADKAKEAWEDVVWSLLNTKEFLFNH